MENGSVSLLNSEPIFPVADVVSAASYYRTVLGFTDEWLWGDPPDFGGARWGKVGVMFALQARHDAKIGGQWHAFHADGTDALYDLHRRNGAQIHSPLESKPWGMREYTVRDLNGHYLRFGQPCLDLSATAGREPAKTVVIVERLPTVQEYRMFARDEGSSEAERAERASRALAGARFGVVAIDSDRERGRVVGSGMVVGDGVTCAYLKNIGVLPDWQGRGVGSRIVEALLSMIRRDTPKGMLVTLFTGQARAEFYEKFGFRGPDSGLLGMTIYIE